MISVRTEASMDYFETDSNSSAPKRVPLSLRLPVQVVESVDRYASENRMSKTDAFLHFFAGGWMRSGESFVWISLSKSKSSFRRSKACCWKKEAMDPRGCFRARSRCLNHLGVPRNRARVPVRLSRGVCLVWIAMSTSASNTTMACPSTYMMCRSSGSASSRLPGARSTWFPLINIKREAWLRW